MTAGASFAPVLEVIERRLGTSCSGVRADIITDVVRRTARRAGASSPAGYARRLEQDPVAREELADALRVPETYFLRSAQQLEAVRHQALPALTVTRPGPLRIWSAGCASGEEAYSLAIVLETADLGGRGRILATDRSAAALAAAAEGVYGARSLRSLEPSQRDRYFTAAAATGRHAVAARLRRHVTFQQHDLVADPFPSGLDLIVCRNVLLYLTEEHGAAVVERFAAALAPGGWLVLGSADPHHHAADVLERVRTGSGSLYRRHAGAGLPVAQARSPARGGRPLRAARPAVGPAPPVSGARDRSDSTSRETPELVVAPDVEFGQVELGAVELEHAIDRCRAALVDRPLEAGLHERLATLLLEAGRAEQAHRVATAAVFLDPERALAQLVLGRSLLAMAEPASAARTFRHARELLVDLPVDAPVGATGLTAGRLHDVADAGARLAETWGGR